MVSSRFMWRSAVKKGESVVAVAVVLVLTIFTVARHSSGDDVIEEKLTAAKVNYEDGRAGAKAVVIKRYHELIAELSEEKELEEATRVQDELKHFDKNGIMIPRNDMTQAFLKYGEILKRVSEELSEAYTDAAAAHVKAGEFDRADALRRELATYSLPAKLVSLQLFRTKGYIQHGDYLGWVNTATKVGSKMNSTFEIVNGLSESSFVSIRSINCENHYLHHGNLRMRLGRFENGADYRKNATFKKVRGLASASAVSFESVNFPGHFIRARNGELWLDKLDDSDQFRFDASFVISAPLFKLWKD